jgi:hypothetical protein
MSATDRYAHFEVEVPELALTNPILLYSICAYTARFLSIVSNYEPTVADQYHGKCLELLIPMLDDVSISSSEILLAATCILRLFEQISGQS